MSAKRKNGDRALNAIREAIHSVDEELTNHSLGRPTVSNPQQLFSFRQVLAEMEKEVIGESASGSLVGIGRVVVDSWPFDSELAERILAAEQAYTDLSEQP
jgi:hypothetical protein